MSEVREETTLAAAERRLMEASLKKARAVAEHAAAVDFVQKANLRKIQACEEYEDAFSAVVNGEREWPHFS